MFVNDPGFFIRLVLIQKLFDGSGSNVVCSNPVVCSNTVVCMVSITLPAAAVCRLAGSK